MDFVGYGNALDDLATMFRIARSRHGSVAVGLFTGTFAADQLAHELDRAYRMNDLAPGIDSVIVFDPAFRAERATVAELVRVSAQVAEKEGDASAGFQSIFVVENPDTIAFSEVYFASWKSIPSPRPRHTIVATLAKAEELLGVPDLSGDVEALMPRSGLYYFP